MLLYYQKYSGVEWLQWKYLFRANKNTVSWAGAISGHSEEGSVVDVYVESADVKGKETVVSRWN